MADSCSDKYHGLCAQKRDGIQTKFNAYIPEVIEGVVGKEAPPLPPLKNF